MRKPPNRTRHAPQAKTIARRRAAQAAAEADRRFRELPCGHLKHQALDHPGCPSCREFMGMVQDLIVRAGPQALA